MPTILVHTAGITKEGTLDKESLIRLRKAFSVYQGLLGKGVPEKEIYFVSSVQSRKEGCLTMSEMMRDKLIQWDVPAEQIVISNQSTNTKDDILNSFELIKANNLPRPIKNVSSWYHILRIWLIWLIYRGRFGYPEVRYVFAGAANYSWIFQEPGKILRLRHILRYFF